MRENIIIFDQNKQNSILTSSNQDITSSLYDSIKDMSCFMTSAEIVIGASGLRIEAIRAIAHEQGIDIEDEQSRCIDENLLEELANAHVRRLKSYFNNTKRHLSEVSGADLMSFIDFCKTFKKHQTDYPTAESWNDIDTDAIREQFFNKVYISTPSQSRGIDLFVGFKIHLETIINRALSEIECRTSQSISDAGRVNTSAFGFKNIHNRLCAQLLSYNDTNYDDFQHKEKVLNNIIHCCWYYSKPIEETTIRNDFSDFFRIVAISARYHIFTREDDEDHQIDTITTNGHF